MAFGEIPRIAVYPLKSVVRSTEQNFFEKKAAEVGLLSTIFTCFAGGSTDCNGIVSFPFAMPLPSKLFFSLHTLTTDPMQLNTQDTQGLHRKVARYKEVLQNTLEYRKVWKSALKKNIKAQLHSLVEAGGLPAVLEEREDIHNLEAVVLTLGVAESGLGESLGSGLRRDLIKQNGSLVYQQLFNGKILVLINYPFIEKYGQPQPPKTIAIYRPEELKEPYFLRHVETFVSDITAWEDYDDDLVPEPNQRIGFKMNFEEEKG